MLKTAERCGNGRCGSIWQEYAKERGRMHAFFSIWFIKWQNRSASQKDNKADNSSCKTLLSIKRIPEKWEQAHVYKWNFKQITQHCGRMKLYPWSRNLWLWWLASLEVLAEKDLTAISYRLSTFLIHFYRAMLRRARLCHARSSVCLSVHLSVTFMFCTQVGIGLLRK